MNNLSTIRHPDHPRPPLGAAVVWIVRILALVAAGVSAYLMVVSIQHGNVLGCSPGTIFDCDEVLSSKWSKVLELPVAAFGVAGYATIFVLSWFLRLRATAITRWALSLIVLLSVAAAAAAIWFIAVQLVDIKALCHFCLLVHVCGLTIASLLIMDLSIACARAAGDPRPVVHLRSALVAGSTRSARVAPLAAVTGHGQFIAPVLIGLLAVSTMIALQVVFPSKTNEIARAADLGGELDLDAPLENSSADTTSPPVNNGSHVVNRPLSGGNEPMDEEAVTDTDEPTGYDDLTEDADGLAATAEFDDEPQYDGEEETAETSSDGGNRPTAAAADRSELDGLSRTVSVYDDQIKFDIYKQAYIGSPEAPHVVVELFDYTCKHCRKLHNMLLRAQRRYGNQVVLVVMPVPMEASCNPHIRVARIQNRGSCKLARLALAVSIVRPNRFDNFHHWLLDDDEKTPTYSRALVRAYDEYGRDQVRTQLEGDVLDERIRRGINLYMNLAGRWQGEKGFGLPVLIVGDQIASGGFEFEDELFQLWESALGIEPGR